MVKNDNPLVSIIVPVYNVEKYISECIGSVLAQSYVNFELILVDDGSKDGSVRICRKYAEIDSRIKAISKFNGGASDARNYGLRHANGSYVTYLDSDDYWKDVDALSSLIAVVNEFPNVDVIFFRRFSFWEDTENVRISPEFDLDKVNGKSKKESLSYLLSNGLFTPSACNKMVRTSILQQNDIIFQKGIVAEDIDWSFYVIIAAENFCAVNNLFYAYRRREGSVTDGIGVKHIDSLLYIIEKWQRLIPRLCPDKEMQHLLLGYCAYQLSIALGVFALIDPSERAAFFPRAEKLFYLFSFGVDRKMKMVKFAYHMLGIKATVFLLGLFLKLKRKKIVI